MFTELFWEHVPRQYLWGITRYLVDAYSLSASRSQDEFSRQVSRWYRPILRRALLEAQIVELAAAFPTVEATYQDDPNGFWSHSVAVCGGQVTLTASRAPDPEFVIRHSEFREQYAVQNPQLPPFTFDDDPPPPPLSDEQMIYGLILHGRDPQAADGRLGFAVVRFPNRGLTGYYAERINLLQEFPDIAMLLAATPVDEAAAIDDEEHVGDLPPIDLNEEDEIG